MEEDVVFPSDIYNPCSGSLTKYVFKKPSCVVDAPVDTTLKECVRRDGIIRPFLVATDWKAYPNFTLLRKLFVQPLLPIWIPFHKKYPFAFDYRSRDEFLLCTDGGGHFLVVKVKSVHCCSKGKHKKVCLRFADEWHKCNPQVDKTVAIVISEEKITQVIVLER